MDRPHHYGQDYANVDLFKPDLYLEEVYPYPEPGTAQEGQRNNAVTELFAHFNVKWLDTFTSGIKGDRMLDFGCGPTLNIAIAANCSFSEIYLCEYAAQNRQTVQDWIDKKPTAHDWTSFLKYAVQRQDKGATWQEFEAKLRQNLKGIFPCDIFSENPFHPHQFEPEFFDCIASSLCLEACSRTEDEYKNAVKKLSNYLKPGGHLVMEGVLNQSYWSIGDKFFYSLPLHPKLLKESLKEAGFVDVKMESVGVEIPEDHISDAEGAFLIRGVKQS